MWMIARNFYNIFTYHGTFFRFAENTLETARFTWYIKPSTNRKNRSIYL